MKKTNENKTQNTTKNETKNETKSTKNCGGRSCGKNTKNCK